MAGLGGDDISLHHADGGGVGIVMGESLGDRYGVVGLLFYGVVLVGILFLLWVTRGEAR